MQQIPRIRGIDLLSALAQLRRGAVAGPLLRAVDLAIDALRNHGQVPKWESARVCCWEGSEEKVLFGRFVRVGGLGLCVFFFGFKSGIFCITVQPSF